MSKSTRRSADDSKHVVKLAALLLGVPALAVLWLIASRTQPSDAQREAQPEVPVDAHRTQPEPTRSKPAPPTDPREADPAQPIAASSSSPLERQPELTLASTHSEFEPGDPSHPMSPERLRAYRQNDFIGQIDGAILVRDAAGIRRLNAAYRAEYPDDDEPTRQAYDMIADCIEHKTPELVERARQFWETKRSSRARRDLRKICLQ